jgi:hypothetical protein
MAVVTVSLLLRKAASGKAFEPTLFRAGQFGVVAFFVALATLFF